MPDSGRSEGELGRRGSRVAVWCSLLLVVGLWVTVGVLADGPTWYGTVPAAISTGLPGYVDTWSPAIAAGGGLQVAVWSDGDEVAKVRDIYAAYSHDAGLSWSAPQPISTTTGASVEPDVLIAGEQVFAAWSDGRGTDDLSFTVYLAEAGTEPGPWTVEPIPGAPSDAPSRVRIAAGAGRLHVVYNAGSESRPDIWYTSRSLTGSVWTSATLAYTATATYGSWAPAVAISPDGQTLHLVWEERNRAIDRSIMYMSGTITDTGVNWHRPAVKLSTGVALPTWPTVAVDGSGGVHVAYGEQVQGVLPGQCQPLLDQYVRYIGRTPAGSWMASSVRIDASPMCVNASIPRDLAPRLLVTGRGNPEICALWHGFRPSNVAEEVWISCSDDPALGWPSPPRNVSRSEEGQEVSIWPAGVADRMGNLHVVWQERTIDDSYTDYQIYYARSQRMALPAVFRLN